MSPSRWWILAIGLDETPSVSVRNLWRLVEILMNPFTTSIYPPFDHITRQFECIIVKMMNSKSVRSGTLRRERGVSGYVAAAAGRLCRRRGRRRRGRRRRGRRRRRWRRRRLWAGNLRQRGAAAAAAEAGAMPSRPSTGGVRQENKADPSITLTDRLGCSSIRLHRRRRSTIAGLWRADGRADGRANGRADGRADGISSDVAPPVVVGWISTVKLAGGWRAQRRGRRRGESWIRDERTDVIRADVLAKAAHSVAIALRWNPRRWWATSTGCRRPARVTSAAAAGRTNRRCRREGRTPCVGGGTAGLEGGRANRSATMCARVLRATDWNLNNRIVCLMRRASRPGAAALSDWG